MTLGVFKCMADRRCKKIYADKECSAHGTGAVTTKQRESERATPCQLVEAGCYHIQYSRQAERAATISAPGVHTIHGHHPIEVTKRRFVVNGVILRIAVARYM